MSYILLGIYLIVGLCFGELSLRAKPHTNIVRGRGYIFSVLCWPLILLIITMREKSQ